MALSDIDRSLLQRCLARKPRAWEDFVDRFMGLVVHVVNHSAQCRSLRLGPEDREDLVAQVFLTVVNNEMAVLRNFRGDSSLATYLTVIARRVVVHELVKRPASVRMQDVEAMAPGESSRTIGRSRQRPRANRTAVGRVGRGRSRNCPHVSSGRQKLQRDQHGGRHARKQRRSDAEPRPSCNRRPIERRPCSAPYRKMRQLAAACVRTRVAMQVARRDASPILNPSVDLRFRCPGETYWIDRSTHLAPGRRLSRDAALAPIVLRPADCCLGPGCRRHRPRRASRDDLIAADGTRRCREAAIP